MRGVAGIVTIAVALAFGTMLGPALLVAEAHTCNGENPSETCGGCTSGTHHHSYLNSDGTIGKVYCSSSDDEPVPEEPPMESAYGLPEVERGTYILPKVGYALPDLGFFR